MPKYNDEIPVKNKEIQQIKPIKEQYPQQIQEVKP